MEAPTSGDPPPPAPADENETSQAYCLVGVVVGVVVSALNAGPAGPLIVLGSVLLLAVSKAGSCRPAPEPADAA